MSSSGIDARAEQIGAHPVSRNVLSTYQQVAKHPNGGFMVPAGYNVQSKQKAIVRQAPITALSGSSFLNGSSLDFKLDRSHLSIFTNAYIQVKISNSTGGSITLAPTPFWVDRIEIQGPGGQILTMIRGQELFLTLSAFLSRNEFEQMAPHMCLSTAYATTGTVLANGASDAYYIPLFHLFSACKLHLDGLAGDFTVRILTQSSTYTLLAGTHPTVSDVALIMKGFNESSDMRAERKSTYHSRWPLKLPFINIIRHLDNQTLAASTQYSTLLSTLRGTFVGIFITVRAAAITATNQGNYQALTSFDLQLASGESLLGHYVRLDEDNKLECAELFNNLFAVNKDAYFISFSSDPVLDCMTGSVHGYQVFSGAEKLQFSTPSTLSGGSYIIDVYGLSAEHCHIQNGQLVVKK